MSLGKQRLRDSSCAPMTRTYNVCLKPNISMSFVALYYLLTRLFPTFIGAVVFVLVINSLSLRIVTNRTVLSYIYSHSKICKPLSLVDNILAI